MLVNVTVEFLKDRIYEGKHFYIGDIVKMNIIHAKAYFNSNSIKYYIAPKNNILNLENKSYKELQSLCKKYDIPAIGKREELISQLMKKTKPS